jgi:hypothetical protein
VLLTSLTPMSFAETRYQRIYDTQTRQYYYVPEQQSTLRGEVSNAMRNPVVKQAAIGAAVGAATGLLSDRTSLLKGAGVGALVGAGTGYVDRSATLSSKPLVRTALKGAAIGTGAGMLTQRGAVKGALIGGAAGAGWHYLQNYLDTNRYRY